MSPDDIELLDGLINGDLLSLCKGRQGCLIKADRGGVEKAELAGEGGMTCLGRADKDNSVFTGPVGLCRVEGLQRVHLDGHLPGLTSDILDECRVVENDGFPMESSIQGGDHVGVFQDCWLAMLAGV